MPGPETTAEMSMLPRMVQMITRLIVSSFVSHPLAVAVDVGSVRMAVEIAEVALLRRPALLARWDVGMRLRLWTFWGSGMCRRGVCRRCMLRGRRRSMRRNVAAAHMRRVGVSFAAALLTH